MAGRAPRAHPRAGAVAVGDQVYAHHHEHGPLALRVLAHGRDGFTGEAEDGRRHAVPYDRLLGHRARVKMDYKVLDAGADGAIVEDHRGRRSFMAGDLTPPPPEAMAQPERRDPLLEGLDRLAKALEAGPALLLKAGALANRPGLALRDVTDKAGHQTKRWVRTMKDQPKPRGAAGGGEDGRIHDPRQTDIEDFTGKPAAMKHGDVIRFRHGQVEGQGRIVSSGRDGVTVQDEAGQAHQVRHDAIAGPADGGDRAERSESAPDAQEGQDAPPLKRGGGGKPPGGGDDGGDGGDSSQMRDGMDDMDARPSSLGQPRGTTFKATDFYALHDKPEEANISSLLARFPSDTSARMEAVLVRLKGVTTTAALHKKDKTYSPERRELHEKIIEHFLSPATIAAATPESGREPTFTILGGRGGSGKSWFKGRVYDPAKAIVLDADEIKQMLPEYQGWNAFEVHEESGDIFDWITEKALDLGLNIVHDATMRSPESAVKLVAGMKKAGYRVEAHYMHLPRVEAAFRAVKRFLSPTGRFVPPEVIFGNTENERAFDLVKEMADAWSFRDNQGEGGEGPRLIASSDPAEAAGAHRAGHGLHGRPPAGARDWREGAGVAGRDAGGAPLQKGLTVKPALLLRRLVFWRR